MQKTAEHAKVNRVSPAAIGLLIHERNKGRSLRRLGQMFGISHERVRQILAKHNPSLVTFLAESTVAVKLGYPISWLINLRGEGIIKPTKPGDLLGAVNTSTAVTSGWNKITITSTGVVAGNHYWLAYNSSANLGYYSSAGGTFRYKTASYSTFTFPDPAGSDFKTIANRQGLLAGWGYAVPPTPPSAPTLVSPGASITFKWNASSGATNYHLQVNTSPAFTGTDIFNGVVGDVTSYEVTGFTLGTTYYWRVKAGNAGGWSDWSSVMSVVADVVT